MNVAYPGSQARTRAVPPTRWRDGRWRRPRRHAPRSMRSRRRCTSGAGEGRRLRSPAPRNDSAQPMVSNSSTEKPIKAEWAAMSAATSALPRSALHRKAARRLASSISTQSTAFRHPGPFQVSHLRTASAAKCDACRSLVPSSSPASESRSSAKSRMVSNSPYLVWSREWSARIRDLRTNESRRPRISTSSLAPITAQSERRSNPPENTEAMRMTARSASSSRS